MVAQADLRHNLRRWHSEMKRIIQSIIGILAIGWAVLLLLQWPRLVSDSLPTSYLMAHVDKEQSAGTAPSVIVAELPDKILGAAALEHGRGMNARALFLWAVWGLLVCGIAMLCLSLFGSRKRKANDPLERNS